MRARFFPPVPARTAVHSRTFCVKSAPKPPAHLEAGNPAKPNPVLERNYQKMKMEAERMRREIEAEKDIPLSQRRYEKIDPKFLEELLEREKENRKHSVYG